MELIFKVVRLAGGTDEIVATASNFVVASAAYDTSVSLWPAAHIELRQGARIINKSKEED
jgi:hypothetical protein